MAMHDSTSQLLQQLLETIGDLAEFSAQGAEPPEVGDALEQALTLLQEAKAFHGSQEHQQGQWQIRVIRPLDVVAA